MGFKRLMVLGALLLALIAVWQPVEMPRGDSPVPTPTSLPSVVATPTGTVEPTAIELLWLRATSK
jgi:hypothetical protein